jgi:8-oxo-dGTP pyrophosphatase MutT (NUDIX family)
VSALEAADTRQGFLVCVVFVIEREGRILLLRRSLAKDHAAGEWETGSGGVLPGETPQAAVVREAKEETGLEIEIVSVIDAFHFYRGTERRETIGISFHCRAAGGEVKLSDEHEEARWVAVETARADAKYPEWLRRAAAAIEKGEGTP